MNTKLKKNQHKTDRSQSAFSLIEVLVALLILSVCVVGAGKMLSQSIANYKTAELRERVTILAWSIADYIRTYPGTDLGKQTQEWQKQLAVVLPGSVLTIQGTKPAEGLGVYTITIRSTVVGNIALEVVIPAIV